MRERSNFLGIKSRISKIRELKMWFRGSNLLHRKRNSNPAITAHASTPEEVCDKLNGQFQPLMFKANSMASKSSPVSQASHFFLASAWQSCKNSSVIEKNNHFMWRKWFLSVKVSFLCPVTELYELGPLKVDPDLNNEVEERNWCKKLQLRKCQLILLRRFPLNLCSRKERRFCKTDTTQPLPLCNEKKKYFAVHFKCQSIMSYHHEKCSWQKGGNVIMIFVVVTASTLFMPLIHSTKFSYLFISTTSV